MTQSTSSNAGDHLAIASFLSDYCACLNLNVVCIHKNSFELKLPVSFLYLYNLYKIIIPTVFALLDQSWGYIGQ